MTRPPCVRLYPAYPGNPRLRIEGESPQSGKDIRSSLCPGYDHRCESESAYFIVVPASEPGPKQCLCLVCRLNNNAKDYGSRLKAGTTEEMTRRISNRLARIRHGSGETAVDGDGLAVDVGCFVACQKQSHRGEFVRLAGALERIELADLVGGAALLGAVEHRFG